ncbi:DUF2269 domain-containing protein [Aquibacillus koreensis]|uniref:DUF2269 domain-containing protein n=1 Tax=Aquibacillus koreensis TaxID=279446 RepID=A0A9X4AJU4_9BACI|nr:DUF2269 domain-containing protein [Aquibacillus koreensis]MCT2534195.1 DUF2269 domain-containing protein [Aquibacillus koreensis]MDC3422587.1 DUF2269 domain-containing protein [Aquibacillus koreensis]
MEQLYSILVFIHIFSAIMGMGPGFFLTTIPKSASTMTELRHAYAIRHKLHIFVMIGGTLLLITGLAMGAIHPYLFRMPWYIISLSLYLIALAMGPTALKWYARPIKQLLVNHKGEEIPKEYDRLSKSLFLVEYFENTIFIIIIILMIWKPV